MFLGNDLKNKNWSPAEGFYEKSVLKNFAKITEKHLCRGLIFNKDSSWGAATLLQINPGIGVFL